MLAGEFGLGLPVALLTVATPATRPRRVPCVHEGDRDPGQLGLVADESLQLGEGPSRMPRPVSGPNRCPIADALEVFEGNPAVGALGQPDKLVADAVVLVPPVICLASGHPLELTPGALGAGLLVGPSGFVATATDLLDGLARVGVAVGIGGEMDDPEIDPKEVFRLDRGAVGKVHRGEQEELTASIDEIDLTLEPVESLSLVLAVGNRYDLPSRKRPEAYAIESFEREDSFVVGDGTKRLEDGTLRLVPLEGLDRLSDGANSHLSREAESLADRDVSQLVDAWLTEDPGIETGPSGERGGGVEPLRRGEDRFSLFDRRDQLKLECEFHTFILGAIRSQVNRGRHSSLPLRGGSPAAFFMKFHAVLGRDIKPDQMRSEWERGLCPRHSIVMLMDRTGGAIHVPDPDLDRPTPADRIRSKLFSSSPGAWALARRMTRELGADDIVYCMGEDSGLPMAAAIGGRGGPRLRLFVFVHNIDRPRGRAAARATGLARHAAGISACCGWQHDFLRDYLGVPRDRLHLILEHIDDRFFTPGPASAGKARPVIAGVGLENRDYRSLAEATADLDVDVRISGFSPFAATQKRSLPDPMPANMSQRFYSWPDLVQLYRDADVVVSPVFPSHYAAGVTTLLEAQACRRPVIATRSPGLADYLDDDSGALVIEPGDPAALRRAIVGLLERPDEAEERAERGYRRSAERHRFDDAVDHLAGILSSL